MAGNPVLNARGDDLLYGGEVDPRVTPVDAPKGSMFIFEGNSGDPTPAILQKNDNGLTTNWGIYTTGMSTDFSNAIASAIDIDLGTHKLVNVVDPTDPQDAATKNYVDNEIGALSIPSTTDALPQGVTNLYFPEAPNDGTQYARKNLGWEAVISSPSGSPNTVAFYNNGGDLASTAAFSFDETLFAVTFGYLDNGGSISAGGFGGLSHGYADAGQITTTGLGAHAHGSAPAANASIIADGNGALAHGQASANRTIYATAEGSTAFGRASGASIWTNAAGSLAFGVAASFDISADGNGSFAGGYTATGAVRTDTLGSFAWGDDVRTRGRYASSFGVGQDSSPYAATTIGRYAAMSGYSSSTWVATDPVFAVGIGASTVSRANALTILKDGTSIFAGGPIVNPNLAADPSSPTNGMMWYNTTTNQLKAHVNGVTVVLA